MYLQTRLAKGKSLKEIAREAGRSPGTVGYWVRKHGFVANGSGKYDPNKTLSEEEVRAMVDSGHSASRIAIELGVSTQTIIRRLEKMGTMTARQRRAALIAGARASGRTTIQLECPAHGLTSFWVGKEKAHCHRCNSKAVARRRRKVKRILVEEAGGACILCGYDRSDSALQFHHLDPSSKVFGIAGAGVTRSLASLQSEAEKCVLLCANCHAEVEIGIRRLD